MSAGQRKRIEDVVQHALANPLRVQILMLLNEGQYTAARIAEILDIEPGTVRNHLKELLNSGSIEIAEEEDLGNINRFVYRAVEVPYISQVDAEKMTEEQRHVLAGLVLQGAIAEGLAGLRAKKLADPRAVVFWDWIQVDPEGRYAYESAEQEFLNRVREIEAEATNRRAVSGEESVPMLVCLIGCERARKTDRPPANGGERSRDDVFRI